MSLTGKNCGRQQNQDNTIQAVTIEWRVFSTTWGKAELLTEWGFQISMSRKGNPYDNAVAECFMRILKYEEVYLSEYETFEDAVDRLPRFIIDIYNRRRIHSSIGYLTPEEFEARIMQYKQQADQPLHNPEE